MKLRSGFFSVLPLTFLDRDSFTRWLLIIFESAHKGHLVSECFLLWLKSTKKCAKNYPEHYPTKEKMLRIVIRHIFWEI